MKALMATLVGLILATTASQVAAYVVVVPTSIPVSSAGEDTELEGALRSAVDDVLEHAIAFFPTFVTIEHVRVVGNRIYILLEGDDRLAFGLESEGDLRYTGCGHRASLSVCIETLRPRFYSTVPRLGGSSLSFFVNFPG